MPACILLSMPGLRQAAPWRGRTGPRLSAILRRSTVASGVGHWVKKKYRFQSGNAPNRFWKPSCPDILVQAPLLSHQPIQGNERHNCELKVVYLSGPPEMPLHRSSFPVSCRISSMASPCVSSSYYSWNCARRILECEETPRTLEKMPLRWRLNPSRRLCWGLGTIFVKEHREQEFQLFVPLRAVPVGREIENFLGSPLGITSW